MHMNSKVNEWEKICQEHKEKQLINPFSGWAAASHREALSKTDKEYGHPVEGTLTEYRGKKACSLISDEIVTLIDIIKKNGISDGNKVYISFGKLFDIYTSISNKLVGLLLRARKHGLIRFEGEMLYQRRDEHTLVYVIENDEWDG